MRTQTVLFEGKKSIEAFNKWMDDSDISIGCGEITRIEVNWHKVEG